MSNIYENLEPNELTTIFPQLSEKQLSSIGVMKDNNRMNITITRWRLGEGVTAQFASGGALPNRVTTRGQFLIDTTTISPNGDLNTLYQDNVGVYVKVRPNSMAYVLFFLRDTTLASIFTEFKIRSGELSCNNNTELDLTFTSLDNMCSFNVGDTDKIKVATAVSGGLVSLYFNFTVTEQLYELIDYGFDVYIITQNQSV